MMAKPGHAKCKSNLLILAPHCAQYSKSLAWKREREGDRVLLQKRLFLLRSRTIKITMILRLSPLTKLKEHRQQLIRCFDLAERLWKECLGKISRW